MLGDPTADRLIVRCRGITRPQPDQFLDRSGGEPRPAIRASRVSRIRRASTILDSGDQFLTLSARPSVRSLRQCSWFNLLRRIENGRFVNPDAPLGLHDQFTKKVLNPQ